MGLSKVHIVTGECLAALFIPAFCESKVFNKWEWHGTAISLKSSLKSPCYTPDSLEGFPSYKGTNLRENEKILPGDK